MGERVSVSVSRRTYVCVSMCVNERVNGIK